LNIFGVGAHLISTTLAGQIISFGEGWFATPGKKERKRGYDKKLLYHPVIIEATTEDFSDHLDPAATQESANLLLNEREGMLIRLCL
jgi:hypothetical protein